MRQRELAALTRRTRLSRKRVRQLRLQGYTDEEIVAGSFRRTLGPEPTRDFPYATRALLGHPERMVGVEVIGVKPLKCPPTPGLTHHASTWRLAEVLVDGERRPRFIAAERLEERP